MPWDAVYICHTVLHGWEKIAQISEFKSVVAAVEFIPERNRDLALGYRGPYEVNG